jgi:nitrogen regulatory protein PII
MSSANSLVLKLAVFIVDWSRTKKISTLFPKGNERFHFVCKGLGTASSEILDMLGIGSIEKAVIICLEDERKVAGLLRDVGGKLGLHNRGAGIAFTIPLSSINHPVLKIFTRQPDGLQAEEDGGEGVHKMREEIQFDLIVAILNQGYSDEFMQAARDAGAGGGTIINARGLSSGGTKKIFGISIQDEKEIIIILSTRAKKTPIMSALSKSYGVSSKADGLIFSLPVDAISGVELR